MARGGLYWYDGAHVRRFQSRLRVYNIYGEIQALTPQGRRKRGASTGMNTSTGSEVSLIYLLHRPRLSQNSA